MNLKRKHSLSEFTIRSDLRCGDLGQIIALHGTAYEPVGEFGLEFEAYVARTIAEYFLDNNANGQIWLAERDDRVVGCAAIAKRGSDTGQLRWVLVEQGSRGTGLGRRLVETALQYCEDAGLTNVYLETTLGLDESMRLYEDLGFELESEETVELWNGDGQIITMRLEFS